MSVKVSAKFGGNEKIIRKIANYSKMFRIFAQS